MDNSTPKEKILKKVRAALLQKGSPYSAQIDLESDVFMPEIGEPIEVFASNFTAQNGDFIFCYNPFHFADEFLAVAEENGWQSAFCLEPQLQELFKNCEFPFQRKKNDVKLADVGVTGCDALVARTGSVVLSSKGNLSRTASIFPPVHVVIAYRNQVHYDLKQYFASLNNQAITDWPSMTSIVSGPSRTADIEKTLVLGAHGPKQIFVFYIEQDKPL